MAIFALLCNFYDNWVVTCFRSYLSTRQTVDLFFAGDFVEASHVNEALAYWNLLVISWRKNKFLISMMSHITQVLFWKDTHYANYSVETILVCSCLLSSEVNLNFNLTKAVESKVKLIDVMMLVLTWLEGETTILHIK